MKTFFLSSTLVLAVIFLLPLGLFAETKTDNGAALSDSIMPVLSYDGELQTDGHNQNYASCRMYYEVCLNRRLSIGQCYWRLTICNFACEVDAIAKGNKRGMNRCYQEE